MDKVVRSVTWEAPEHHHTEAKGSDWYWILSIVAVAVFVVAVLLNSILFGILILLAASVIVLISFKTVRVLPFAITTRGVRIDEKLYPYSALESFYIDEDNLSGAQLLLKSKHYFMPLLIMPLPEGGSDEVEAIIETRLPAEHLEEPLAHKLFEWFVF